MKKNHDLKHSQQQSLISDVDFVELIGAEYRKQGFPVDEIGKKHTWDRISNKIRAKKSETYPWMSLSVAALVVMTFIPLIIGQLSPATSRIKGVPSQPVTTLSVNSLHKTGLLSPLLTPAKSGDTIAFKISSTQSLITALAIAINSGNPTVRFIGEPMPGGQDQILQRAGRAYAYQIEEEDKLLEFCLIAASTKEELKLLTLRIESIWATLPPTACNRIRIK